MTHLTKRQFIAAAGAAGGAMLLPSAAAGAAPAITTYRDPSCGCCPKRIAAARKAGFAVTDRTVPDIMAVKARLGVPDAAASCHTSMVGGYVVEGHVPLAAVARLLRTRPKGITGIAVPGMPRGSPGMEMPDGSRDAFTVVAFNREGATTRFGG
jgi:hypothetical protein